MKSIFLTLFAVLMLSVACQSADPASPASPVTTAATEASVAEVAPETPTEVATAAPDPTAPPAEADAVAEEAEPSATPEPIPTLHPADQIVASFDQPSQTNGDLLFLVGQVLDVNGNPVPNAAVEIWQTDVTGVYDHPGDRGTDSRDLTFQFFGTATADADGWYGFRTIVPGEYEPRPRHIHFKVKLDGQTVLTSQFYFSDDIAEVENEGIFRTAGTDGNLLLLQLVQREEGLISNGQIVIDTGIGSGELTLTPSQAEGPFYPVVPVADYDNDLAILP